MMMTAPSRRIRTTSPPAHTPRMSPISSERWDTSRALRWSLQAARGRIMEQSSIKEERMINAQKTTVSDWIFQSIALKNLFVLKKHWFFYNTTKKPTCNINDNSGHNTNVILQIMQLQLQNILSKEEIEMGKHDSWDGICSPRTLTWIKSCINSSSRRSFSHQSKQHLMGICIFQHGWAPWHFIYNATMAT